MRNSVEINIDLNSKDKDGRTAFHWACLLSRTSVVNIMINNSESLNLDLTAQDNEGKTGFKLAQDEVQRQMQYGHNHGSPQHEIVKLIKSKMPRIAF